MKLTNSGGATPAPEPKPTHRPITDAEVAELARRIDHEVIQRYRTRFAGDPVLTYDSVTHRISHVTISWPEFISLLDKAGVLND